MLFFSFLVNADCCFRTSASVNAACARFLAYGRHDMQLCSTGPAGVNPMSKSTQSFEGDSLTLACDTYGFPSPQVITWYKDDVEISPSPALTR